MSRKTSAYARKRASKPEQMAHAHSEALKIRAKSEVAA